MNFSDKKKYLLLLVIIIIIGSYSCNSQKKTSSTKNSGNDKKEFMEIKNTYSVSAHTKMFISGVNAELKASGKGIEEYTPSEEMNNKFNFRKIGDSYFVSGFIYTDDDFKNESLEKFDMHINPDTGNIRTINFNIRQLPDLLNLSGITYLEISIKAELK